MWIVGCITYSDIKVPHHTVFQARSRIDPLAKLENVGGSIRRLVAPKFTTFEVVVEQEENEAQKP